LSEDAPSFTYRAGFGVITLDDVLNELCLMGWAHPKNIARKIGTPIHVRALALEDGDGVRSAYVCAELCFISASVRQAVVEETKRRWELPPSHLMLTATHTHSGPNGFSRSLFYAGSGPGFCQASHDRVVEAIVEAIALALEALQPAEIRVRAEHLPLSSPVAFNRSLKAHNRNTDVTPRSDSQRDRAVNREMTVLRVDTLNGQALGQISWFGLHGTSLHWDNESIHSDHFGVAASSLQDSVRREGHPDFVSIFAQGAAGDVTSNYRWDKARRLRAGHEQDDSRSADFVGAHLARHALKLFRNAKAEGELLRSAISAGLEERSFADAPVDPEFAFGRRGETTESAALGANFSFGTAEGPGPWRFARPLRSLAALVASSARNREIARGPTAKVGSAKKVFWHLGELGRGRLLGLPAQSTVLKIYPNRFLRYYCEGMRNPKALQLEGWLPARLPFQVLSLGSFVIAGLPNEPTTHAGVTIAEMLKQVSGASRVVVNGYANAYAGYLCTHDEYHEQSYEGAATFYGPWSLAATQTVLRKLTLELPSKPPPSPIFPIR